MVSQDQQLIALYKDSLNIEKSFQEFKINLEIYYPGCKIIKNSMKEQNQEEASCEFALENIRIIAQNIKENQVEFIKTFSYFTKFCSDEQIELLRKEEFAYLYAIENTDWHINAIFEEKYPEERKSLINTFEKHPVIKDLCKKFPIKIDIEVFIADKKIFKYFYTMSYDNPLEIREIIDALRKNKFEFQVNKLKIDVYSDKFEIEIASYKQIKTEALKKTYKSLVTSTENANCFYKSLNFSKCFNDDEIKDAKTIIQQVRQSTKEK